MGKIGGMGLRFLFLTLFLLIFSSCASKAPSYEKAKELNDIKEYEKRVHVTEIEPPPPPPAAVEEKKTAPKTPAPKKTVKKAATPPVAPAPAPTPEPAAKKKTLKKEKLPKMEDAQGFDGRRPLNDPFRIGEKVTLDVTYFNIKAGEIDLKVNPFVEFNNKKSYAFAIDLRSYSFFSHIYSLDDHALTYVDYESLIPYNLSITIKESKQLAETRTLFDWDKNKATYWKKRYTEDHGEEKKEVSWDIKPFSQNVISALYYLRTFQLKPGKKLAYRVADEGKNIVFTGEVLRKEKLKTKVGTLDTVVVKPTVEVDGAFKPVGDILIWLTDDDRKFVVRIESKIKIGTLVAKLKSIDKGRD
jgi:hypothetical protein